MSNKIIYLIYVKTKKELNKMMTIDLENEENLFNVEDFKDTFEETMDSLLKNEKYKIAQNKRNFIKLLHLKEKNKKENYFTEIKNEEDFSKNVLQSSEMIFFIILYNAEREIKEEEKKKKEEEERKRKEEEDKKLLEELKKKNQKPKCQLMGDNPTEIIVKKSDIEDGKEFNKIKIKYKNIGEVSWTKKYKIELLNNYNENIKIKSYNYIEKVINKGETYNVNISLLIFELEQQNYLLEFVLKNEKGDIVENSKATFNLNIENENENSFEKEKVEDIIDQDNQDNEFNDLVSDGDIEQIYNELKDEINIENIINFKDFKIKLIDLLKKEKDNYKKMDKEDRINNIKDKMMDLVL